MIIKHCINCDATAQGNHFQEWLPMLEAGSKVKIQDDARVFLDLEYVKTGLNCAVCLRNKNGETVTMVVFKWSKEE